MNRTAIVLAAALSLAAGSVQATDVTMHWDFDQDGVLLSADPDLLYTHPGNAPEADTFSVSGGTMVGTHLGTDYITAITYTYPADATFGSGAPFGANFTYSDQWVYEARLRVLEFPDDTAFLGGFKLWNNGRRFHMFFTKTGVRANRYAGVTHVDYDCDPMQWHTLRMEGTGNQYFDAYVDGVLFASHQRGLNQPGDGFYIELTTATGDHGSVEWDYIHFEAGANVVGAEEMSFGAVKALFR